MGGGRGGSNRKGEIRKAGAGPLRGPAASRQGAGLVRNLFQSGGDAALSGQGLPGPAGGASGGCGLGRWGADLGCTHQDPAPGIANPHPRRRGGTRISIGAAGGRTAGRLVAARGLEAAAGRFQVSTVAIRSAMVLTATPFGRIGSGHGEGAGVVAGAAAWPEKPRRRAPEAAAAHPLRRPPVTNRPQTAPDGLPSQSPTVSHGFVMDS